MLLEYIRDRRNTIVLLIRWRKARSDTIVWFHFKDNSSTLKYNFTGFINVYNTFGIYPVQFYRTWNKIIFLCKYKCIWKIIVRLLEKGWLYPPPALCVYNTEICCRQNQAAWDTNVRLRCLTYIKNTYLKKYVYSTKQHDRVSSGIKG